MLTIVNEKVIAARKSGDKFTFNSFQLVKAELLNNQKTDKPKDETEVVKSYVKKLGKSLEAFKGTSQYDDLVKEYELVKTLLPQELSEEGIRFEVNRYLLSGLNPEDKNIGKVMGHMKTVFKDSPIDGGLLSKVVKDALTRQ